MFMPGRDSAVKGEAELSSCHFHPQNSGLWEKEVKGIKIACPQFQHLGRHFNPQNSGLGEMARQLETKKLPFQEIQLLRDDKKHGKQQTPTPRNPVQETVKKTTFIPKSPVFGK